MKETKGTKSASVFNVEHVFQAWTELVNAAHTYVDDSSEENGVTLRECATNYAHIVKSLEA